METVQECIVNETSSVILHFCEFVGISLQIHHSLTSEDNWRSQLNGRWTHSVESSSTGVDYQTDVGVLYGILSWWIDSVRKNWVSVTYLQIIKNFIKQNVVTICISKLDFNHNVILCIRVRYYVQKFIDRYYSSVPKSVDYIVK